MSGTILIPSNSWEIRRNNGKYKRIAWYQLWKRPNDGYNELKSISSIGYNTFQTIPKRIGSKNQEVVQQNLGAPHLQRRMDLRGDLHL
ncbi:hypothetical protein B9Z55_021985 [Caenorhabditis nigoni]|uniref:Uncharacterized protein n=1 Tax=Caenorhabditis nigoni TaxID=1611254 RepID=A0A2G5TUF9_9PELO|nr:hypothetical protein B9Z55_021985 [Caenorhabditis nigoni]